MKLTINGTATVAKYVVSTVVGIGTTKIVRTIINNNIEPETTKDQITVTTASVVIGMMAADASKEYTNAFIDQTTELIHNFSGLRNAGPIIEED